MIKENRKYIDRGKNYYQMATKEEKANIYIYATKKNI